MAGHSKWANIQHRKDAQDKRRARTFSKLIRELTTAARIGGSDPQANPRLRLAMERARAASMPRDTIERAVKRGSGEQGSENFQEVQYEGYGPGGVAVMVRCLTDNRNRTVSDVRNTFSRHGGNLGADGKFLPVDALRRRWQVLLGAQPATAVIAMCGSGVTACHNLLALEHAGLDGGRLTGVPSPY